jgi:hypothetical protein
MPSPALVFLAVVVLVMIGWVVIAPKIPGALDPLQSESKKLLDLRHRLWAGASNETGVDLLDRTRVVFVQMNGWEQRLDHRLEDPYGGQIGMALQQPRPRSLSKNGPRSRFSTVRVEISDHTGRKRLEVVRPSGLTMQPLQVIDASGELLGTVKRQGRRTFVVQNPWGLPVGLIEGRSGAGVDYALKDRSGRDLGTISDYWHLAERAKPPRTDRWSRLKKALDGHVAREHVLELTDPHLSHELHALLLGAAASVYLAFQRPFQDGGD